MCRGPAGKLRNAAAALFRNDAAAGNPFIQALVKASDGQAFEVWPENWRVIQLFVRVSSQWDAGMGGPICLKYPSLYPLLDRVAADDEDWWALFDDVRTMESAALEAMRDKE